MRFEDLYVGMTYAMSKAFSSEEVQAFSQLSMDDNPLHIDDDFAKNGLFGRKIVHGFLSASLFSAIIGTKMPGEGSVYLSQNMKFYKPVYHNQIVTAYVTVKELYPNKRRVLLQTECKDEYGNVLIDGDALVKIPK